MEFQIENLTAGVVMKTSYTEVSVKLQDIVVEDLNTQTIHSTVRLENVHVSISMNSRKKKCILQILTVVGGDALSCQIVLYNLEETDGYNSNDMTIDVSMGCVKIIFLNWFVNSVLVSEMTMMSEYTECSSADVRVRTFHIAELPE